MGIIRVSQTAGREGDSFVSPREQRSRIEKVCRDEGLELVGVHEELDVSGGTPLGEREGLRAAIEAVEDNGAQVIVVAYFDRLVRSLSVQAEVVGRVEAAGGRILAADLGEVSAATATQWVSSTMLGMVAEYQRRAARERSGAAQAMAVARGVPPFDRIPPGYTRSDIGTLVPNDDAPAVREAFRMRAQGATIAEVRAFLLSHGIERTYHGVQSLLSSRIVLGEIHFGKLENLEAHEPIIDRDLWAAVQRVRVSRGRRAKSDRLLARLGVLRCGTCDGRMIVGSANHGQYPIYRCSPVGDCPRRVTISAEIAERVVSGAVRELLADEEGHASALSEVREADAEAEVAQRNLEAAIRVFDAVHDEAVAAERLRELRADRDLKMERAHDLRGLHSGLTISVGKDWGRLSMEAKRGLIRAVLERASVAPGRGADRISLTFRVQPSGL